MKEQTCLITGCSSGIGHELAIQMAKRGYTVFATARNIDSLTNLVEEYSENITPYQLDVTNQDSIDTCIDTILKTNPRIDILINNAGVIGCSGPAAETNINNVQKTMETNFIGLVRMVNKVFPIMAKHNYGKIINIGSISGWVTTPFGTIYSASKAAVEAYTNGLRIELSPFGIQVMLVTPGAVKSNLSINAANSSYLVKDGYYENFRDAIEKRIQMSQANGPTPVDEFSILVCDNIDATTMPPLLYGAKYSTIFAFVWYLPIVLKDFIIRRMTGFDKLVKQVQKTE